MRKVKEPKKETVRITLPPRPASTSPASNGDKRDTVRINLPVQPAPGSSVPRPPGPPRPIARPPVLPGLGQPPKGSPLAEITDEEPALSLEEEEEPQPALRPPGPPVFQHAAPAELSTPQPSSSSPGPKKETARIEVMPRASTAPTVKMAKTQPLITAPPMSAQGATVFVEPNEPETPLDSIPMSLCWGLLAISALLFIIQLWIFFS